MLALKEFERDVYAELLQWAEIPGKGLLLRGPRQVGKTFLLEKLARERFSSSLYVNVRSSKTKEWFEEKTVAALKGKCWFDIFVEYAATFNIEFEPTTLPLVILDEIQESSELYSCIRDIVREGSVKLVATGSYLGIAELTNYFSEHKQTYFFPAGDVNELRMGPMTYAEVLRACSVWYPEATKEEIFKYYLQYGGFPEVVCEWVENRDAQQCYRVLEQIYNILVEESLRYIYEPISPDVWDQMFVGVAVQIETKKDILQDYDTEMSYRFHKTRRDVVERDDAISMMKWMLSCDLLWQGSVTNNLRNPKKISKRCYYFVDQGLMMLALSHSMQRPFPPIDKGNIPGMLAENFVALCLRELMHPLSYSHRDSEIDFLVSCDNKVVALEVKFSDGETKSSNKALSEGLVSHIIKVQGKLANTQPVLKYMTLTCLFSAMHPLPEPRMHKAFWNLKMGT